MKVPQKPVLLIEDDPDYVQLLITALTTSGHSFAIHAAPSLAAGLAAVGQCCPEIILVDLTLPDSSGYETFLRVKERSRGIPVIVLTGLDDDHIAIQAVEDGAQDYLVKSLTQPKLIARCLKMALSRQARQMSAEGAPAAEPGIVISFIGGKGGIGTSTTAVNVAALLAQNGSETVAIELQPGRTGTLSLFSESGSGDRLISLLENPESLTPADLEPCLVESFPGLRLLCPATAHPWPALNSSQVHAIISAARRLCRHVVVDLPAHVEEGVAEALRLSDCITVLVDRERTSVQCGAALAEQIKPLSVNAREVYLATIDRTGLQQPLALGEIKNQLKMHPLVAIPHVPDGIAHSQATHTPLVALYPEEQFTTALVDLAERLLITAGGRPLLASDRRLCQSSRTIPEATYG